MCRIHHSDCDSHSTQQQQSVCQTARYAVCQHSLQTPRRRTFCSTAAAAAAAAASMSREQMLQLCSQSSALLPAMELSRLLLADATIYSSSFSSSRFTHSIAAPYALLLPPQPPSPATHSRLYDMH